MTHTVKQGLGNMSETFINYQLDSEFINLYNGFYSTLYSGS